MDLTGKVIAIMQPRSGTSARTGNPWMSQEYVIEVPGQYPRKMLFNIFGEDRIKQFNIQAGEEITVQFDIDAREYNGRWFNDIRAYNIIRGQIAPSHSAVHSTAERCSPGCRYGSLPSCTGACRRRCCRRSAILRQNNNFSPHNRRRLRAPSLFFAYRKGYSRVSFFCTHRVPSLFANRKGAPDCRKRPVRI